MEMCLIPADRGHPGGEGKNWKSQLPSSPTPRRSKKLLPCWTSAATHQPRLTSARSRVLSDLASPHTPLEVSGTHVTSSICSRNPPLLLPKALDLPSSYQAVAGKSDGSHVPRGSMIHNKMLKVRRCCPSSQSLVSSLFLARSHHKSPHIAIPQLPLQNARRDQNSPQG
jgi:hypothetical protein